MAWDSRKEGERLQRLWEHAMAEASRMGSLARETKHPNYTRMYNEHLAKTYVYGQIQGYCFSSEELRQRITALLNNPERLCPSSPEAFYNKEHFIESAKECLENARENFTEKPEH